MQGGKYQASPYQYHGNQHKDDGSGGHKFSPFGISINQYRYLFDLATKLG